MIGMLNLALEELNDPFYFVLDDISSVMHCETPNHKVVRSAIINSNYSVSYSHCNKNSIKTNAPYYFIWNVLKKWIEMKPVKEKWFGSEYRLANIIRNVIPVDNIDLTIR
jgi:tRNA (guanine26-N2/guanine27-N2)-dimethyltransferase